VLARNTRYGQERSFGKPGDALIPLPERLYAGGATSLRGFGSNLAGPRDPETGYPIGGAGALINSTELRLPPATLPWFGNTVSFVLFHDMGNVFTNASDAWASALRVRQPERENCETPIPATIPPTTGLGLRYHTPVGPIRFDFSYNLNPPIYPVTYNYSNQSELPHVGEGGHFNFFFSLGESF
jgi:outer membrane protein assembly factor BamA